jgi:hypothetical protein
VVWCGVWCGVVCGVVWCGVVCGVVWCGVLMGSTTQLPVIFVRKLISIYCLKFTYSSDVSDVSYFFYWPTINIHL